jgi:nicotinamidase/pyrazinamidase
MANDTVLVVTDVQNDFCPGGALAVERGDEVVPLINHLIQSYEHVVLTQDWHPLDHASFASQHPNRRPFETIEVAYGSQTLWPDHCVQGSAGAEFHPQLHWTKAELILRKGFRRLIDSYSAFFENDRTTPTGLGGYLRERGIKHVVLTGLATDFCVGFSALDARNLGFTVTVVEGACRAIDLEGSLARMKEEWAKAGVHVTGHAA